jgi:hypothetical protein
VNGDGYGDVIVGAFLYDNGETDEGQAFVYHGSASGLSTTPDWTAESDQINAQFGACVSSAGDVNGDGYGDVIVGALYYDNGETDEGRAFVYHGSASGLSTTPDWTAESDQAGAHLGFAVSSAGDVNGDGYDDVIAGAFNYDNGEANEGGAFVYHGSALGLSATPAWTAESDQAGADFGYSVSSAGDVNGDGYGDVIVGAFLYDNGEANEGRAFVYHGSALGLSATPAWMVESDQVGANFGRFVSDAGDVNGDGYGDVIVGAFLYDNPESNEGRAYVYHGNGFGLSTTPAWTAESDQASGNFGYSVSSAGDVNGDGWSDVIVGAYGYDNGESNEGRAYVYLGNDGTIPVMVQNSRSHWADNCVEVTWILAETGSPVTFEIYRRMGEGGNYVPIHNPEIVLRGGEYVFKDVSVEPGASYGYRVAILENDTVVASFETSLTTPTLLFALKQNHPNPFNPSTQIGFSVDKEAHVKLRVYDVSGRLIQTIVNHRLRAGTYLEEWDGRDDNGKQVVSGVYFIQLSAEGKTLTRKSVLLK